MSYVLFDHDAVNRGGKIVYDNPMMEYRRSTNVKDTESFNRLVAEIREQGFDPTVRQHVKEFNLAHPDSYQTLTSDEHDHTNS